MGAIVNLPGRQGDAERRELPPADIEGAGQEEAN